MDRNDRFSFKKPRPFFSSEKKYQDLFLAGKKLPARAIRIFYKKTRDCLKIHVGNKKR
jgi:hypothetical protein